MRNVWGGIAGALALLIGAGAARADLDAATRSRVFERVWSQVRNAHWDPTLGGVDWDAVKERYAPQAAAAGSDAEFYGLLNRMLGELKQSHFGVIPPDVYLAREERKGGAGEVGLSVGLVDGEAVALQVSPGSSAARAGLAPGFVLTEIGGEAVAPVLEKIAARHLRPAEEKFEARLALRARLAGVPGSKVAVTFRDGADRVRTVELERIASPAKRFQFGALPPLPLEFEQRILPGGVGYIRFNIFLMPLLPRIQAALVRMKRAPALILDLRGNPGGLGAMAQPIAGALVQKPTSLGTMQARAFVARFPVQPMEPRFSGPVAILTDETSASTSEILAGGLQEIKRVVVVGSATAGMVLPSKIEALEGGARLQSAFADFRTPRGVLLEGRGVLPDLPVALTRRALLAHPDPALEAARTYLAGKIVRKPPTPGGNR